MPAAGSGVRFGQILPKQYMSLAGRTVIEWALAPFIRDSRCEQIVVALAADDERFGALPLPAGARVITVRGGAQRADSVGAALAAVDGADDDWVLVHDAARPCVTTLEVEALLRDAEGSTAGALLALPLADTLKRASPGRRVLDTPSRESLWRALTPQMFTRGMLRRALGAAREQGRVPTDEAQAVEWMGGQPLLVPGDPQNLKITEAADLALAESILNHRAALANAAVATGAGH